MSLLLGWGETTLTRYIDGDIPSKPYSDKLIQILENKDYYLKILNKNKNSITNNAYAKSLKACSNINSDYIKISKIESVAKYILKSTTEVTPLVLQKLLYYIQGFNKVLNDEFSFQKDCEAWVHGLVYKNIYKSYKEFGYDPIKEESIYYGDIEITKKRDN